MNASSFPMLQSKTCYAASGCEIVGEVGGKTEGMVDGTIYR